MTTPDTSAVRAWARENGYEVADRGRLPAELTDAYLAANRKPRKSAAKKAAPAKATKPAAKVVEAPAAAAPEPVAPPVEKTPRPKPSVVNDDRRLVALGEEIAALTKRVAALEKAAGGKSGAGKTPRFRRRS